MISHQQHATITKQQRRLIVQGHDAVQGRFPYFVSLDRSCGGALIAPDVVLTAGHCKPKHLDDIGQLHVGTFYYKYDKDAAAEADRTVSSDYDQETFRITEAIGHPQFQRLGDDEFRHDFTLLKLNGQSAHPVVRINRDPNIPTPRQELTAMGLGYLYDAWAAAADGSENSGPLRPDVLQQVNLQYFPNEECRKVGDGKESYSNPPDRIGPTHLCTFSPPDNNRDACAYDSGGPIIIPARSATDGVTVHADDSDEDLLIALVSWGIGCADPVFPGVNARVSSVADWIDKHVCQLSDAPPADFGCSTPGRIVTTGKSSSLPRFALDLGWTAATAALLVACLQMLKRCYEKDKKESNDRTSWLSEGVDNFLLLKRHGTIETDALLDSSDSGDDDLVSYGSHNNNNNNNNFSTLPTA